MTEVLRTSYEQPQWVPELVEDPTRSYGEENGNLLIKGDNLPAMRALLERGFAGTVKCVQIDPPYNTGTQFEDYSDAKETAAWIAEMQERLPLMHELLADTGFLLCHIDSSHTHHLRILLDDIFGAENYWGTFYINTKHKDPSAPDASDLIHKSIEELHVYSKTPQAQAFLPDGIPMTDYLDGADFGDRTEEGGVTFRGGKKQEALIKFGFEHFTPPGGLVFDAYLGSGTGAAVAIKLGFPWICVCKDHMDSHCLPRLQRVVDGTDQTGISETENWQGGSGFTYYNVEEMQGE